MIQLPLFYNAVETTVKCKILRICIKRQWKTYKRVVTFVSYIPLNLNLHIPYKVLNFFDFVLFPLSSLITDPSFMSISSPVLELWQFSFIKDWPVFQKSEVPSCEVCPIFGDWGKLGIPNLARMSIIKYYWMLQNARVTAFTVFLLLRKNQQGVKLPLTSY